MLARSEACTDFTDPRESGARESAFKSNPDLEVTEDGRAGGSDAWGDVEICVESSQGFTPVMSQKLGYQPEAKAYSY